VRFYGDLEKRREVVREYINKNPRATFAEIKRDLHTKIDKVYEGGMEEAYRDARVNTPRTFKRMSKEEKKRIIIDYIRKNHLAGGHTIKKETKINFQEIFKNTKDAFKSAGVPYLREERRKLMNRSVSEKRQIIINLVRKNPLLRLDKIGKIAKTHPHSLFKNTKEIYKIAGIPFVSKGDKRRINKQNIIIDFIKNNTLATQRQVNKACKTHVQALFERGIFEAYERAGVKFPYERLNIHGVIIKEIRMDAEKFEHEIARKLTGYGSVNRLVKTKRGIADIILERRDRKVAIELKNYKCHEISISEINQLNRYLEDIGSNLGFLICLKKPKKDTFLIGENKIIVLEKTELGKIPQVMDL